MAPRGKKRQSVEETNRENGIPEGFDISAERVRGEGWAKKEKGNIVHGTLMGRVTYDGIDGERAFYQVMLASPCLCVVGEGEETTDEQLDVGALVNVDEVAAMLGLKKFVDNGGTYDIWLRYEEKVKGSKGTTPWQITGPKLKMTKAPPKPEKLPF